MDDVGWSESYAAFRAAREEVEWQTVVAVADRALHREVLVNPLRARRVGAAGRGVPVGAAPLADCRWCDPARSFGVGILSERFGNVVLYTGRAVAGPNHARLAPLSGLVFGDAAMHDLVTLTVEDITELFEAAAAYMKAASGMHAAPFWVVIQNGGPRSASTVDHAHLQVLGRTDRHFGYPAGVAALTWPRYWQTTAKVHLDLGLAVDVGGAALAYANLAPVKERDLTALTNGPLVDGARAVWPLLQSLITAGTTSWSLAAIVNPRLLGLPVDAYREWPDVIWRVVDRGDIASRAADIGAAELYASTVVAADPYVVADLLRSATTAQVRNGR